MSVVLDFVPSIVALLVAFERWLWRVEFLTNQRNYRNISLFQNKFYGWKHVVLAVLDIDYWWQRFTWFWCCCCPICSSQIHQNASVTWMSLSSLSCEDCSNFESCCWTYLLGICFTCTLVTRLSPFHKIKGLVCIFAPNSSCTVPKCGWCPDATARVNDTHVLLNNLL